MNIKMLPADLFPIVHNGPACAGSADLEFSSENGPPKKTPEKAPAPTTPPPAVEKAAPPADALLQSLADAAAKISPDARAAISALFDQIRDGRPRTVKARKTPAPAASAPAAPAKSIPVGVPRARYYLCTVTDKTYLVKILAQYRTLDATTTGFHLFVCCTDEESYRVLNALRLPHCTPVGLKNLGDRELYDLQRERKANEFCWTLKSYLMMYLIKDCNLPHVLYCDGDIGFTSDLSLLYEDWGGSSIYLCTQRDVDWVEKKYGKYQAGILGIRNNETGFRMLRWWKNKCREWCFAYEDNGRLGDQKYLDEVPALFEDVKISWNKGINAAPWNLIYNNGYKIAASGGGLTIDGDPLAAYHFACLSVYDESHFDLWSLGHITIQPEVLSDIYVPYLKTLRESAAILKALMSGEQPLFRQGRFEEAKTPFVLTEQSLELLSWDNEYAFCTVSSRTYTARTLALYSSIRRHMSHFHLWVCCADDTAYAMLSRFGLANTTLLRVEDVETPEIRATRSSKTLTEYCWTLKPALCSYVFRHYNVNRLLYCDSDIYFFSHPRPIYELWNNYTTLLNRQLGSPELEARHGMYQAGMIGFTKEAESLRILDWWLKKCTEWCYDDHSDPSRWGDQKYLQQIPDLFESIRVNSRYGLVAAPWNIVMNNTKGLTVSRSGSDINIGSEKLIAYHFGSINMLDAFTFDLWKHEPLTFDKRIIDYIYSPYLRHLSEISRAIEEKGFGCLQFADIRSAKNPFRLEPQKEAGHAVSADR